jgi:hypothetical protein
MQTDIWLNEEISYPERCPLCSESLKEGSTTCLSCGFSTHSTGSSVWIDPAIYGYSLSSSKRLRPQSIQQRGMRVHRTFSQPRRQPNPVTPIPLRASAQPANAVPGSIVITKRGDTPKRNVLWFNKNEQRDSASFRGDISAPLDGKRNSTDWEYKSSEFQAESSLPALSLLVSEAPTRPEQTSQGKATHRLPQIDEIDTTPVMKEISSITSSRALVPTISQFGVTNSGGYGETTIKVQSCDESASSSWTAGEGSQSSYARLISSSKRKKSHRAISLNPVDRIRWWLLRPGRIEFVLWLGGTILLVCVTCVLLLVTAFSFEWLTPEFMNASSTNMPGSSAGSQEQATVPANGRMTLTRVDNGPLFPGQPIRLHGQGFSPHGHIIFLFDGAQPLLDKNGKSDSTQADAGGEFTTTLWLNDNLPWNPGSHFINAQDLVTKHKIRLAIILVQGPIGRGVTSTPMPVYPPVVTATPIQGGSGGQPTPAPVGQTPVPITPTTHPVTPTVTPTVGTTPTVTPTVGMTPTVTPPPVTQPTVTPATSTAATGNPSLGNALDNPGALSLGKQLTHLSPWVWAVIACYSLSMLLLGLAGVLHKHRQWCN